MILYDADYDSTSTSRCKCKRGCVIMSQKLAADVDHDNLLPLAYYFPLVLSQYLLMYNHHHVSSCCIIGRRAEF